MANKQITNMEVKKNNRNRIFRYICKNDMTSNPDIMYDLKMNLPTVIQNTKELMEKGLVEERGELQSTGGRRAKALSAAADFKLAVGLDITKNHISIVLTNLKGELLGYDRTFQPFGHNEGYYRKVNQIMESFVEQNSADSDRILGIGISIPGIVNLEKREITHSHALQIDSVPFDYISDFFAYPCSFLNDANAGAYAEGIHPDAPERFFYISLSSTVGGAVFEYGDLVQGKEYRCGEVGHMTIIPDGDSCYCGMKGCLDAYCSEKRLTRLTNGNLEQFFLELDRRNPEFVTTWDTYTTCLTIALNNIYMILDCEIVLGGYVGGFMETYMRDLCSKVGQRNIFVTEGNFVRACVYKFEAAALGAALTIIERYVEQI